MAITGYAEPPKPSKGVLTITAPITLTQEEHDLSIRIVNHASAFTTIDLPAVTDAVGMNFTIIMAASLTADCVIDSQANDDIRLFQFNVTDTAANIGVWTEGRYLTYDESTGTTGNGNIGDRVDIICDGSYYHAIGFCKDSGTWVAAD